jgi:CRISPR-associated protein Cmr2
LLPSNTAIECGRDLAKGFAEKIGGATLSAGIAVVHYRQPLSISLQQARAAEKMAKRLPGKNALCLALYTRGGSPLYVAQHWDGWKDFEDLIRAFENGQVTRGVAYELRDLAGEFENANVDDPSLLWLEAERIWKRKQVDGAAAKMALPKQGDLALKSDELPIQTLRRFADMLVAARFLTAERED